MNYYVPIHIDHVGRRLGKMLKKTQISTKRKARKNIDTKRAQREYFPLVGEHKSLCTSYASEHLRMKPVMDVVRRSQDCKPISAGFEIQGEFPVRVTWAWHEEREEIIGVNIETDHPFELAEQKVKVLFTQAGLPKPACIRA